MLRELRYIQNSLSPINSLPREILSEFFRFAAFNKELKIYEDRRVNKLSLVCRGWRYSILSDPQLWSCIRVRSSAPLDGIGVFLSRSKSTPLHVFYHHSLVDKPNSGESPNRHINELFNQTHRMQTLEVVLPTQPPGSFFPLLELNKPAPCLETLEISYPTGEDYDTLPPMFNGHTPRLRNLSVYGLKPWTFITCKSLTSLNLTEQGNMGGNEFLDFLDGSPELVKISLERFHISGEYMTTRSSHLPKLASLELTMCYSPSILAQLWLPEATSIIIDNAWVYAHHYTDTPLEGSLIDALPNHYDRLHSLGALMAARLCKKYTRTSLTLEGSGVRQQSRRTTVSGWHTWHQPQLGDSA